MDNDAINEELVNRKVKVRASDIIKKFKSIQDRQAFCKENSKLNNEYKRFNFSKRVRI